MDQSLRASWSLSCNFSFFSCKLFSIANYNRFEIQRFFYKITHLGSPATAQAIKQKKIKKIIQKKSTASLIQTKFKLRYFKLDSYYPRKI